MKKIFRILLIFSVCLSFVSCKKIIKTSDNFIEKKILSRGSKEISKEVAEKSAKELGSSYVGKSVGHQIVRNAVRKKVKEEMKEEGVKSFLEFGSYKASKKLTNISVPSVKNKLLKRSESIGNYISINATRIRVTERNQFVSNKRYLKWIKKNGHNMIVKTGVKDSKTLRENMYIIMDNNSKYAQNTLKNANQAHHIVGNRTPVSAEKLKKFGIDINDPMNGIFLPSSYSSGLKGTIHKGGHTQDYYEYVEQRFMNCHSQKECYEILDRIKEDLFNGKIKLYNNHQVNRTFKKTA